MNRTFGLAFLNYSIDSRNPIRRSTDITNVIEIRISIILPVWWYTSGEEKKKVWVFSTSYFFHRAHIKTYRRCRNTEWSNLNPNKAYVSTSTDFFLRISKIETWKYHIKNKWISTKHLFVFVMSFIFKLPITPFFTTSLRFPQHTY